MKPRKSQIFLVRGENVDVVVSGFEIEREINLIVVK